MIHADPYGNFLRTVKSGRNGIQRHHFFRDWVKLFLGLFFMNLRQTPGRILGVARLLQETSRKVEPEFLEIGRILESLYGAVKGLTKHVNDVTLKLSGAEDENLLQRAERLADEAREILESYRTQADASLDPVKTVIEHLETLFSACDQIDRIATNLRVVGINIGVESTRSADARSMFSIVSEEIIKFSDSIVSIGERIRSDVSSARTHEEKALIEISTGLNEFQHLSAEAAAIIRRSVDEINGCIGIAQNVFDESGRRFEEIALQVGEIVAALQFHDSMRQRVEHMASALTEAGNRVMQKQNGFMLAGTMPSRLAAANDIVNIQNAQLRDIIEEIEHVHRQGAGAFQAMEKEVVLLVRSMTSVCDHVTEGEVQEPFSKLVSSLQHLMSLVERAEMLVGMIEESIARGANISARFSHYLNKVEKISVETHIKAINAIIKSDHLGEKGRTLEVLAQEMSAISKVTDQFVSSVKKKLRDIGDFAKAVQNRSDSASTSGDKPDSARVESIRMMSRGIEEIVQAQTRMKVNVEAATLEAERFVSDIRRSLTAFAFLPNLADEMAIHSDRLEAVALPLRPFGVGGDICSDAETDRLAASYTMQRERDVHATLVAGNTENGAGGPALLPETGFGKKAGNHFDPLHPEELQVPQEEMAQMCSDAELLGDNVELF